MSILAPDLLKKLAWSLDLAPDVVIEVRQQSYGGWMLTMTKGTVKVSKLIYDINIAALAASIKREIESSPWLVES